MNPTPLRLEEQGGRVGQEIGVSPWLVVDQARIDRFAGAIDDMQWIHVDPVRARDGPFGGTIAHGFLTLSLLPQMRGKAPIQFSLQFRWSPRGGQ